VGYERLSMSAVTGTTGIITKGLKKYLEPISRKNSIYYFKKCYTGNITHKGSIIILKPGWWCLPLLQESQEKREKTTATTMMMIIQFNSIQFFIIYVLQGQLQTQHSVHTRNYIMNKHNIKPNIIIIIIMLYQ
jgi:hypothetical protein